MKHVTAEQLAEWKALADAATEGPWLAASGPSSVVGWPVVGSQGRSICRLTWFPMPPAADSESRRDYELFSAECAANAYLIAAARTAIPTLVAEVDRLRAELIEERTAILELQREACARDGVPMPSERPLVDKLRAEIERLRAALNTPEIDDFARGVVLEAQHQRARWGVDHDAGKENTDWFWLIGYLAGKALAAANAGNHEKALHHTISTAAALANWHAALSGANSDMQPGHVPSAIRAALPEEPADGE